MAALINRQFLGLSGGQIFHEMMRQHNVKVVFGYPGAGHMAEGYARISGKPGVCLVTSGPGATNMITPMQALSDGIPLVVFSGQVPTSAIGSDAFQEADVIGISRACTKWNVMIKSLDELPRCINQAFHIATSGRPGPVLVDLPKDITAGILNKPIKNMEPLIPGKKQTPQDHLHLKHSIERAAKLLNKAKKPILYVGAGILSSERGPELLKILSHKSQIPVTTTLQGLGGFDELDPLSLHMLGMHGSAYANLAMQSADLIISLGARFDDRVTGNLSKFAPAAKKAEMKGQGGIIHFEIMARNINKVLPATEAILGDVTTNLESFIPLIEPRQRVEWLEQLRQWKIKYPFRYSPQLPGAKLKPQQVIQELDYQTRNMKENVIITTGVGQHQMWAAQYFRWRHPRSFVTSGGLGTMGFGLPSAIGAKIAQPDKIVVDIDGDASFSMTGMELMTARQYNIGVKVLILNNEFQGMVKQWQDLFYEKRYSGTPMTNPDFVKFAQSMGCKGLRVKTKEDLPGIMAEFLETKEPVVLDAVVCKDEHVYPMVPAGKALHEMELGDYKLDESPLQFRNSFASP